MRTTILRATGMKNQSRLPAFLENGSFVNSVRFAAAELLTIKYLLPIS